MFWKILSVITAAIFLIVIFNLSGSILNLFSYLVAERIPLEEAVNRDTHCDTPTAGITLHDQHIAEICSMAKKWGATAGQFVILELSFSKGNRDALSAYTHELVDKSPSLQKKMENQARDVRSKMGND